MGSDYPKSRSEPYYERQSGQSIAEWHLAGELHQTVTDIQDARAQRDYMRQIGNAGAAHVLDEYIGYLLTYLEKLRKGQVHEFETD